MKKKLLVTLVMIAILISGCSSNQSLFGGTMTNDFDSKTNLKAELEACSYEIPNTWTEGPTPTEKKKIYYTKDKNVFLHIQFSDTLNSEQFVELQKNYIKVTEDSIDEVKIKGNKKDVIINGHEGFRFTIGGKYDDKEVLKDAVYLNTPNGLVSFALWTYYLDSDKDYTEDFNKILDSLHI